MQHPASLLRHVLRSAVWIALCASHASAQLAPEGTASLLAMDRNLARHVAMQGQRVAMLGCLMTYGILFDPRPVEAMSWLREHDVPEGTLNWWPEELQLGSSGELGFVLSRWEQRSKDGSKVETGHQVTIWRWWPKAEWKLLLRIATRDGDGASTSAPSAAMTDSTAVLGLRGELHTVLSHEAQAEERALLLEADRGLSSAAAKEGFKVAFLSRAASDVRVLRDGMPPARGREAAEPVVAAEKGNWSCEPMTSRVADSGDLGYTYGHTMVRTGSVGVDSVLTSSYVRVWRKVKGRREIALDVTLPIPPAPSN